MDNEFEKLLAQEISEDDVNRIFEVTENTISEKQELISGMQKELGRAKTFIHDMKPYVVLALKESEHQPEAYPVVISGLQQVYGYGQYLATKMANDSSDVLDLQASGSTLGTISPTVTVVLKDTLDYKSDNIPSYAYPNGEDSDQAEIIDLLKRIYPEFANKYKSALDSFIANSDIESLRNTMFLLRECYRGLIHKYSPDEEVIKQVDCEYDKSNKPTLVSRLNYIARERIKPEIQSLLSGSIRSFKLAYSKMNKAHDDDTLELVEVKDDIKFTFSHIRILVQALNASGCIE